MFKVEKRPISGVEKLPPRVAEASPAPPAPGVARGSSGELVRALCFCFPFSFVVKRGGETSMSSLARLFTGVVGGVGTYGLKKSSISTSMSASTPSRALEDAMGKGGAAGDVKVAGGRAVDGTGRIVGSTSTA